MHSFDGSRLRAFVARLSGIVRPGVRLATSLRDARVADDHELCLASHLACFTLDGRHLAPAHAHAAALGNAELVLETRRLARLYRAIDYQSSSRHDVLDRFEDDADDRGIEILRVLQKGTDGRDTRANVVLGVDRDGIAKVYKEIDARGFDSARWGQDLPTEDALYERVGRIPGLARFYGVEDLGDGLRFLRYGFCYGQSLLDFLRDGRKAGPADARLLVGQLARTLAALHARGVLHGDLRPQNVRVGTDGVPQLFDLGLGYVIGDAPDATHDAFVTDGRYLSPEMVWTHRIGRHTEVFQLGALLHQLSYGMLPCGASGFRANEDDLESIVLAHGLPTALLAYRGPDPVVARMLDHDPARRPAMEEVADQLAPRATTFVAHPPRFKAPAERRRDTVLLPMRMGLPHVGHVDLIARVIDLGYRALISLQYAYTVTERDPYPKWDVLKMVARSLTRLGYRPDRDFAFTLTRLFETDREHEAHFAMMPEVDRVAAMASGNPDIHHLLARPVFDQKALFGEEGVPYETRSWGERLRASVREGDRETFDELAACGVTDVRSFDELRATYARTPVAFVPGYERFLLAGADGEANVSGRIRRYGTPDEHVVARLNAQGIPSTLLDPYARHTAVAIGGRIGELRYADGELQPDGTLLVRIVFHPT